MTAPFTTTQNDTFPMSWISSTVNTISATVTAGLNTIALPSPDGVMTSLAVENLTSGQVYLALSFTSPATVGPPGGPVPAGRLLQPSYHMAFTNDVQGQALYIGIWAQTAGTINLCRFYGNPN